VFWRSARGPAPRVLHSVSQPVATAKSTALISMSTSRIVPSSARSPLLMKQTVAMALAAGE
jgi:hypothetical protein